VNRTVHLLSKDTQPNSSALPPHNLPVQLTPFIGREREVHAACELLRRDEVRLLTLTGAPGIGKTRLAIEVATSLLHHFADGIYFVNLAPITDSDAVVQTIATALGIRQIGDQPLEEVLSRFLYGKQILLLLDNFEQLLGPRSLNSPKAKNPTLRKAQAPATHERNEWAQAQKLPNSLAVGPEVAQLLKVAPGLKVLVTSRELLRLSGEHDFPVPPLSLPPVLTAQGNSGRYTPLPLERLGDYESVQLFVQRAAAYKPDFVLGEENAYTIAAICRKLDGLPLSIELAAARIRHLSPQAIFDRLQDRLALLTGGARDLPLRQRTLRATIEWSYSLLSEEEERLFRRLAVFRGGRTLEAVEAVCNANHDLSIDPLNGIASLVDKSLLQQATGMSIGSAEMVGPRYFMLETLQEYAKEKLEESGEAEALYTAHALYFTELAELAEPELHGPQQVEWLGRLESERDNFHVALGWAYRNSLDLGLRLVAALNIYWNRRGYLIEGREWASDMISRARETLPNAHQASMARALYTLGFIAFRQGNLMSTRDLLGESVQIHKELQAREEGDTRGLVESLNILGIVASRLENMQARRRLHEKALELARQVGDKWGIARSLYQLGHVARLTGDYALGRSLFEESLALFQESGDKFNIGLALVGLGQMAERQADYQQARRLFEQSLSVFKELGDKWGIAGALYCLACSYLGLKDYERARTALEENVALTEELGTRGDMAEALEKLGRVAYFQGDYAGAHLLYKRSLSLLHGLGEKMGIARCLMNMAGVVAVAAPVTERHAKGKARVPGLNTGSPLGRASELATPKNRQGAEIVESAARLLGTAQTLLETIGFQLDPEDRELSDRYIATARTQLGEQTFATAWAEGRAMTIDEAIACAQAIPLPEFVPAPGPRFLARGQFSPVPEKEFGGLTRREREVAALVTQGESNREIAAELVVSERTVEGHVNNILSKLGFRSRSQISAWAVAKGLVKLSE
jgi:predicted ATPase/DNA-binding CsgD family transcriptional regulator